MIIKKEETAQNQKEKNAGLKQIKFSFLTKKNLFVFLTYNIFLGVLYLLLIYLLPFELKQKIAYSFLLDEEKSNSLVEEVIPDIPLQFWEVLEFYTNSVIYISAKDDAAKALSEKVRNSMIAFGSLKILDLDFRDSYAAVLDNGKIVKEVLNKKGKATLQYKGVTIESAGYDAGNKSSIFVKGINVSSNNKGFNVVIINKENGELSRYSFDFHSIETPYSRELPKKIIWQELESLQLIISEKSFSKLSKKRKEALAIGVLISEDNDLVPAEVIYKGEKLKADIRLKGDWTEHLEGNKWSFRIKLKNGATIKGMKKFSIHHPSTRNYLGEWVYHKALKREGVMNLRYGFVTTDLIRTRKESQDTIMNLGIYALEESFTKYLVENNRHREGVIIKINENLMWEETAQARKLGLESGFGGNLSNYKNVTILPYSEKKVLEDSTLSKQFRVAKNLFYNFTHGILKADQAFNVEKLGMFNAISNLLGSDHGLTLHNARLYYNPITSLLEPIGFDGNSGYKIKKLRRYHKAESSLAFMKNYAHSLEKISTKLYLDSLWNDLDDMETQADILKLEFPKAQFSKGILEHNQAIIKKAINPVNPFHAFLIEHTSDKLIVELKSITTFPIEILNITYKGKRVIDELDSLEVLMPKKTKHITFNLPKGFRNLFVNKKKGKVVFMADDLKDIVISYRTYGTNLVNERPILPWKEKSEDFVANDFMRKPANIEMFDFLLVDHKKKEIKFKTGIHQLNLPLIIPKGFTVKADSTFELDIINYAKIISYSSFKLDAHTDPVKIYSSDKTGQGILILNSKKSTFSNVIFDNLSNPSHGDWKVTGAINFYESPVSLINVTFSNNHCEDALNIIRSSFEMDSSKFINTYSDAFDGDYVKGTISNSTFEILGNDAIDISGSQIIIKNIIISNAGDKGLSAGENSLIKADNVLIEKSEIAVASKDLSSIAIEDLTIKGCKLGFTAFQKKSEFGNATININKLVMDEVDDSHLIEFTSSLTIDGVAMSTSRRVKDKMYGVEYGKSSK